MANGSIRNKDSNDEQNKRKKKPKTKGTPTIGWNTARQIETTTKEASNNITGKRQKKKYAIN